MEQEWYYQFSLNFYLITRELEFTLQLMRRNLLKGIMVVGGL